MQLLNNILQPQQFSWPNELIHLVITPCRRNNNTNIRTCIIIIRQFKCISIKCTLFIIIKYKTLVGLLIRFGSSHSTTVGGWRGVVSTPGAGSWSFVGIANSPLSASRPVVPTRRKILELRSYKNLFFTFNTSRKDMIAILRQYISLVIEGVKL